MKKQKSNEPTSSNLFDLLSNDIVSIILGCLNDNPLDKKSFSLVCRSFHAIEAQSRKSLKPLRAEHLKNVLNRYPFVSNLDLSLCPRICNASLSVISSSSCKEKLGSINLSRSKFITRGGLLDLVLNCVNLVEIDLSNATELQDSAVSAVGEARNLERLNLTRCESITDIGVGCIAVGCVKLKVLSLKWCLGVGDDGVGLIAVKCKGLQSLDLSYLMITNECLTQIIELQHLEYLSLEGCYDIDDDSLTALKHGCKSLETLDMSSCLKVTHVGLSSVTSGARGLRELILSDCHWVNLDLADSLQKLSMLQSLKLDGCRVTCSGLKAIGNWCKSLVELSLSKCEGVTDEGLSSLVTKHIDLRKLDITCCRKLTHVSLAYITNSCTSLTSLKMESCTWIPAKGFPLIGQRCPFIEELDLTDNEIDNEGLKYISRCSRLSSLKLGLCLNITDEGLIHISMSCSKLKELDVYRSTGITDTGIMAIARGCRSLEMINIAYCTSITDRTLTSLSKCSMLNTLESRGCSPITSCGVAAIAQGCKQLTKLDMKKCRNIDDAGMMSLVRFSQNLRQINLSYTSVTDVGLLALASISCLQSLTILNREGLTPTGLAAVLLACGGLTKVKLHASFMLSLPPPLFGHMRARGCDFHWRDKVYRAEIDSRFWKLQWVDVE